MKRTIVIALFIGLVACQGTKTDGDYSADANKVSESEITSAKLDVETTKQLITGYLKIKDALINTDAEKAAYAADEILFNLEQNDSKVVNQLLKEVQLIAKTKDVDEQRIYFEGLSFNIYTLAKNTSTEMNLYQQYCPMAFDNTGAYWVSDNEKVLNPYFGDKMLRCGKVTEVIE